ncbi:lupus La protein homolog [Tiliqua scincoides]|uniref:lupus La protein homolog n=1 Tax=Tiliqua scincoides TaxID=71010 RepID=UPI003461A533
MDKNGNDNVSDLERKVCQQIEYYFGDYNLPRDKFLQDVIKKDDGWVTLKTIITFNRLKCLTTDFKVIVEALRKSKTGLMEVSNDKSKIRRTPNKPLPAITKQYKNEVKSRSVYIKGFPLDSNLDDIKGWLDNKGKIENIFMRRTLEKSFKGSVFTVFDSVEAAKKFVDTPNQKYDVAELTVLLKEDYFKKKNDEKRQQKVEAKAKREEKEKEAEMKSLEKKGCLLKFSGDLEDQTCREDLHAVFSDHCEIKWINFVRGAKEGVILFKSNAKEALEKTQEASNGNLQLRNRDVIWEILEGDVAREALKKIMEVKQELLNKKKRKGYKRKRKGGKGYQGGPNRKVKFQDKKIKFESEDEEYKGSGTTGLHKVAKPSRIGLKFPGISINLQVNAERSPGDFNRASCITSA